MAVNLLGNDYTATFLASGADPNAPYTNVGGGFAAANLTLDAASASVVVTEAANAIRETSEPITLEVTGPGTIALDGANTYSGGTNVSAGTLQIGDSNALGSGPVALIGDATLEATAAVAITNAVTIGAGVAATFGAGAGDALFLDGVITVDGGSIVRFGSATDAGDVILAPSGVNVYTSGAAVVDGGTLTLGNSTSASLIGALGGGVTVGTGAVSATLDLFGHYAEVWNLNGSASGVIINNGAAPVTLTTYNSQQSLFAGDIEDGTGTIALDVIGSSAGPLVLTGYNTYSGGTTIEPGAELEIGFAGTSGSIGGNVVDNGELIFARSDNVFFGGVISGAGQLEKGGAGTLLLTGSNTYSGGTLLGQGAVQVANSGALGSGRVTFEDAATLEAVASDVSLANPVTVDDAVMATFSAAAGDTLVLTSDVTLDVGSIVHFGSATSAGIVVLAPSGGSVTTARACDFGGRRHAGAGQHLQRGVQLIGLLTVGTGAASATLDLAGTRIVARNLSGNANGVIINNGGWPAKLSVGQYPGLDFRRRLSRTGRGPSPSRSAPETLC